MFSKKITMNPNRTLALQESDRVGHAVLGRDAQTHVDVICHQMPFRQFHTHLPTELPQDRSNPQAKLAIKHLSTVFGINTT